MYLLFLFSVTYYEVGILNVVVSQIWNTKWTYLLNIIPYTDHHLNKSEVWYVERI
jgi:hypothetical protein